MTRAATDHQSLRRRPSQPARRGSTSAASTPAAVPADSTSSQRTSWWREREFWLLLAMVSVVYFGRFTALPICGEESRWANGASEMLASGDWIVPRQQGEVFPERPPLGSWTMAVTALVWGRMDAVAVRLPSLLAVLLTTALIYAYSRRFLSTIGAMGAAAAYASFGQVLQLGQLGESESVFTCLLGGALLLWHWGYTARWPALATWCGTYLLAALAALDKGPQAPVYAAAVTILFLLLVKDWKYLFSWSHLAGLVTFAAVVGAWQIPFAMATEWEDVADIWSGLARDRFHFSGLVAHLLSYPLETLGCLLPWSILLVAYAFPQFRQRVASCRTELRFLVVALAVTYPSVWLSAHARGRYFMPLYPALAVLIGIVIDRWAAAAPSSDDRRAWRWFLQGIAATAVAAALLLCIPTLFPIGLLADIRQPPLFMLAYLAASCGCGWLLWHHRTDEVAGTLRVPSPRPGSVQIHEESANPPAKAVQQFGYGTRSVPATLLQTAAAFSRQMAPSTVLLLLVALLGLTYDGVFLNLRLNKSNDLAPVVAELRKEMPPDARLVSLGPISHRFAYFYGQPIPEVDWPETPDESPAAGSYFCFDKHQGDNPLKRANGRGRKWARTLGTLPFEWEEVAVIPCDPISRKKTATTVVVGQVGAKSPIRTAHESTPARSLVVDPSSDQR